MSVVFADAFYFVGLINRADQHHARIVATARTLDAYLLTTEWVLAEFADALAKSTSRYLVARFIGELQRDSRVTILAAGGELFARGLRLYEQRPDKHWSLTDCISFIAMEQHRVTDALTGDKHFEQAGFQPF